MAASRPSLSAIREPRPAPSSSNTTTSSTGSLDLPSRLSHDSGTTSFSVVPARLGCARLRITVPMTSAIRMIGLGSWDFGLWPWDSIASKAQDLRPKTLFEFLRTFAYAAKAERAYHLFPLVHRPGG